MHHLLIILVSQCKCHLIWFRRQICTDFYNWKRFKTVLNKDVSRFWCEKTTVDELFHWRKHYYGSWSHILARSDGLKLKCLTDGFVSYKHWLFTSQDVNWLTGVLWIIVMFLSAVCLILTVPIHWWESHVMLNFSKSIPMKRQTHLHLGGPVGEYIFSKFSFLGEGLQFLLWGYFYNKLIFDKIWHHLRLNKTRECESVMWYTRHEGIV